GQPTLDNVDGPRWALAFQAVLGVVAFAIAYRRNRKTSTAPCRARSELTQCQERQLCTADRSTQATTDPRRERGESSLRQHEHLPREPHRCSIVGIVKHGSRQR